jgi:GAF domain-containing protein
MPKFEVHIPANDQKSFSFTFRVDADGWTAALKAGMARLGGPGSTPSNNMLVDVQDDNSLHVTDAETGRVFQIRELSEVEASTAVIKKRVSSNPTLTPAPPGFNPAAATIIESRDAIPEHIRRELEAGPPPSPMRGRRSRDEDEDHDPGDETTDPGQGLRTVRELEQVDTPAVTPQEVIPTKRTAVPASRSQETRVSRTRGHSKPSNPAATPSRPGSSPSPSTGSGSRRAVPSQPPLPREPISKRGATPRGTADPQVVELERPIRPITGTIGRTRTGESQDIESMLSEVFERVQEVYTKDPSQALYFLLDLAMEKVPVDAGSVLEADPQGDLHFAAARGPKAAELLEANLIVPSGSGIAGFCTHEGVTVALSDVQKDPRFYAEVGRRVDYTTKSVLTSPMMAHGRTFGCMQLLNKKGSPVFQPHEVGILSYIAHQGALYLNALE